MLNALDSFYTLIFISLNVVEMFSSAADGLLDLLLHVTTTLFI